MDYSLRRSVGGGRLRRLHAVANVVSVRDRYGGGVFKVDQLGGSLAGQLSAHGNEALADVADASAVAPAEVRNGLEVLSRSPVSHISSTLRWALRSRRRLDWIRLRWS